MPPFRTRWADLKVTLGRAERWLLPGACLLCRGPAGARDPLACDLCRSRWTRVPEPQCERCGQPTSSDGGACRICPTWPEGFGTVRSAVWLDGTARMAVHHLKYGGWPRIAESLAPTCEGLDALLGAEALVPIPLGRARRRVRGYNQSAELARAISVRTRVPVREDLLVRIRETSTQTRLTPEERAANLGGAFEGTHALPGGPVVLIDDVFTTGATLVAAAMTLLARGAGDVRALTFARARRPLDDDVMALTTTALRGTEESA